MRTEKYDVILKRDPDKKENFLDENLHTVKFIYNIDHNAWNGIEAEDGKNFNVHSLFAKELSDSRDKLILNERLALAPKFTLFKLFLSFNNLDDIYKNICYFL